MGIPSPPLPFATSREYRRDGCGLGGSFPRLLCTHPNWRNLYRDTMFTPDHGMRPHTKKLLIVLTDGKSNDKGTTFAEAKEAADRKGIIRFAIGVW